MKSVISVIRYLANHRDTFRETINVTSGKAVFEPYVPIKKLAEISGVSKATLHQILRHYKLFTFKKGREGGCRLAQAPEILRERAMKYCKYNVGKNPIRWKRMVPLTYLDLLAPLINRYLGPLEKVAPQIYSDLCDVLADNVICEFNLVCFK